MKNRFREFAFVLAMAFLFAGCSDTSDTSEDLHQFSPPVETNADLASTLLDIFAMPDRFDRIEKMILVLRGVTAGQGEALALALEGRDLPNREPERVLIITAWSKFDPAAATKWAIRREVIESVRTTMFSESFYAWALIAPEDVLRDTDMVSYHRNGWDAMALRAFVKGWYDSGQPHLEQFIYGLPPLGNDRQRAVSALIEVKLANEGADAMIAWAATSLKGNATFNRYIYSRLAADIAKVDPQRAVAWCDEICDTKVGEDLPHWIASTWADHSGADAMDWITGRDNSLVSVRLGVRAAFRRFVIASRDEAFAWMESTTEEQRQERPAMQGAIFLYANERSGLGFPEEAIEWSRYLKDERERQEILITIARRWLRQDAIAAEAWLAQSSLSKEEKARAHERKMTK